MLLAHRHAKATARPGGPQRGAVRLPPSRIRRMVCVCGVVALVRFSLLGASRYADNSTRNVMKLGPVADRERDIDQGSQHACHRPETVSRTETMSHVKRNTDQQIGKGENDRHHQRRGNRHSEFNEIVHDRHIQSPSSNAFHGNRSTQENTPTPLAREQLHGQRNCATSASAPLSMPVLAALREPNAAGRFIAFGYCFVT